MKNAEGNKNIRTGLNKYLEKDDSSNIEVRIENEPISGRIEELKVLIKDNKVTDLVLRNNGLTQEEIVDLVNSNPMHLVTYLHLTKQGITDNTLESIVNSPHLQNLEQLHVRDNDIQSVFSVLTKDPTKLLKLKHVGRVGEEGVEARGIKTFIDSRRILKEAFSGDISGDIVISPEDASILLAALPQQDSRKEGGNDKGAMASLIAAQSKKPPQNTTISKLDAQKLLMDVIATQKLLINSAVPVQETHRVEKML